LSSVKSVLVVDDAAFMRVVLKDILKNTGITAIFEAGDGLEAVKSFKDNRPSLVTMDVNMPKADGIQALKAILTIDPTAKVVMVTAVEQKHVVDDAMKIGAKGYITKPFDREMVSSVLSNVSRSA